MKNDHISDKELKKQFPLLFGQKKEELLSAPEGYFETLPIEILEKIEAEEKGRIIEMKPTFSWRKAMVYTSAAAVLVLGLTFFLRQGPNEVENTLAFTLEEQSFISEDMISEFDEDIFLEAMYSDEFELIAVEDDLEEILEEIDIEDFIYEL